MSELERTRLNLGISKEEFAVSKFCKEKNISTAATTHAVAMIKKGFKNKEKEDDISPEYLYAWQATDF